MAGEERVGARSQGNRSHHVLGTPEGWNAFQVVRWHGIEELSQPYRFDITLMRAVADGAVDLDKLLDAGTTFCIASQRGWRRIIHGIIAEAEELERTRELVFYRVLLVPPIWAAKYRRRSRNFVDWTLRRILEAVLWNVAPERPSDAFQVAGLSEHQGEVSPASDPPLSGAFTPPTAEYRWALTDNARVDDADVHPYVVQYNESDFDFLSRLLEREGISYYFEHTDGASIMTFSDDPQQWPPVKEEGRLSLKRLSDSGQASEEEHVTNLRRARRLRSATATVREYDWQRSQTQLQSERPQRADAFKSADAFEFGAGNEASKDDPCDNAALIRAECFQVEAALCEGSSNVRTLVPGYAYDLTDDDQLGADDSAQLIAQE